MSHIKTFARIKPGKDLYEEHEIRGKILALRVPELVRDYGGPLVKNRMPSISYDFMFEKVFNPSTSQEEIYHAAAQDIVCGFLDGYNGTIFAYGQTGTGKTYTVEGSPLRFNDRGLAPRALTQIYKALANRGNEEITLHISYLEIYQEVAYDLLCTTARSASPVTVFPRVTVMEGPGGTCLIRNLSVHLAASEDVAHTLLLQGQANRKVAETPVNQRSSRSHAVFTIYLTVQKPDTDIITRSKLHLVDLAGSERVAKTGVDGQQLTEAKSINLSLHHLESVIIALQDDSGGSQNQSQTSSGNKSNLILPSTRPSTSDCWKQNRHVPYRNSLLTMVLRDSLGGNCLTAMIATVSFEIQNIGETLSTCRFAQRVACIANHARRNEEVDDKTLIRQLKKRVAELEASMACMKLLQEQEGQRERRDEEDTDGKLTDEDKIACAQVVQEYLAGRLSDPVTAGITNPFKFRECLRILKKMVINKYFQHFVSPPTCANTSVKPPSAAFPDQISFNDDQMNSKVSRSQPGETDLQVSRQDKNEKGEAGQKRLTITDPSALVPSYTDSDELFVNVQKLYAVCQQDQQRKQSPPQNGTLAGVPKALTSAVQYKSPFERKREKEIRLLARKVGSMKENQAMKEQQIQILRVNTASSELESMECAIRNKIDVTREQIADQHAYILRLRHTEASAEILAQEKLVESQLVRREGKLQKKLEEILQRKGELQSQITGTEESRQAQQVKGTENRTLEEQFAPYKKRNGTLNTRQVFEMLKSEERKQTKVIAETENEQKVLMTKQLALREAATREKLHQLKEMLRKSRQEPIQDTSLPSGQAVDSLFATHMGSVPAADFSAFSSTRFSASGDKSNVIRRNLDMGILNETFSVSGKFENSGSSDIELRAPRDSGSADKGDTGSAKAIADFYYSGFKPHPSFQSQENPPKIFVSPERSSSDAKDLQKPVGINSALEFKSQKAKRSDKGGQERNHSENGLSGNIPALSSPSKKQDLADFNVPSTTSGYLPKERSTTMGLRDKENSMHVNSFSKHKPSEDSTYNRSEHSAFKGSNTVLDQVMLGTVNHKPKEYLHTRDGSGKMGDTRNTQQPSEPLRTEQMQVPGQPSSEDGHGLHSGDQKPTVMPSEYIRCMSDGEKFDARKMGLSSETFDTALKSMLNEGTMQLSYNAEFYNQFARLPTSQKSPGPKHLKQKSAVASKVYQERETTRNPWGPGTKTSPVSKRLADFLADDIPKPASVPQLKQNKDVEVHSSKGQSSYLHAENNPFIDGGEIRSPRIQALEDKQRELTYMGRVHAERDRIAKIRRAKKAAEAIQRAWRLHRTQVK